MTSFRGTAKAAMLMACAGIAAAVMAGSALGQPPSSTQVVTPPGHVYTCPWIATHTEEALAAGVTCDAATFLLEMGPLPELAPADPGGNIWVPCCGNMVGPGVYAWSGYVYSNYWDWQPFGNSNPTYEAYIQNTSGVNKYHRTFTGTAFWCTNISAASQRWGGHNIGTGSVHWNVDWYVLSQPLICSG